MRSINAQSAHARFRSMVWLMLYVCVAGCAGQQNLKRKSLNDLLCEAQLQAAARPHVVQPPNTGVLAGSSLESKLQPASSDTWKLPEGWPEEGSTPATNSVSLAAASLVAGTAIKVAPAQEEATPKEDLITELFDQTDVREAIQILADYGKQQVIVDETVGGVTSAQINAESFESALTKILMPLGLVFVRQDEKYYIAPPDPDSPLYSYIAKRSSYHPKHHKVVALIEMLPARYKRFVQVSAERNMAVIDAPQTILDDVLERLVELDQPVPQVELEAIVCVVAPDSGFRFGLDWGHVVGINGVDSLKVGLTGLTFSGQVSQQGARHAFSDFAVTSAFVRLLAQEGYVTIRAAPRVTARDGEKAKISIQRETFFSLQPANSNLLFRQDVQKVDAGISLEIVPRVHGDMVNVLIEKAEVSEDLRASDTRSELTANPYPIINRRQVSTEVNVRDGHTIVIGGLVQRQTVDRVNRIPLLGSIPLLGNLFKTVEKQEQDAEVAIFITPRVVASESD